MKRLGLVLGVVVTAGVAVAGVAWLGSSRSEAQRCCRTCPASERDRVRGCCPERFCAEPEAPTKRAGRARARCGEGEHRSAGRCCPLGAEWVPGRGECVCLDPAGCGARGTTPSPSPRATPGSGRGPSCPEGMVSIPGGTFEMGSSFGGEDDERPVTRVTVSGYCLDRTEVTVRAYAQCVSAGSCSTSGTDQDSRCNFRHSDRGEHPMNCVDWSQAEAFCRWRGGRLPTEAEWEYAARGTDGRTYPWGNDAPTDSRLRWSGGCGSAACIGGTAPVGRYPSGASPFGVQDMAGNVWEWVSDWYGAYPGGSSSNPRGAYQGSSRVVRGGSWSSVGPSGVRAADRVRLEPAYRNYNLGFRCARGGS